MSEEMEHDRLAEVADILDENRKLTISMVQRTLRVGYCESDRLIDVAVAVLRDGLKEQVAGLEREAVESLQEYEELQKAYCHIKQERDDARGVIEQMYVILSKDKKEKDAKEGEG